MTDRMFTLQRWFLFGLVSALFFHITASTFTSLGVVLTYMIDELSWSWSEAGLGFSILSLMVGLAGTAPAVSLRLFGIKATFAIGGILLAAGFSMLALTNGLNQYFTATFVLGIGYAMVATVPGVHLINNWFSDMRSFAIGTYMTIGGLGGVAGPIIITAIYELTDSWRLHWWVMAGSILFLAVLAVMFIKSEPGSEIKRNKDYTSKRDSASDQVYTTTSDWRFRDVLRTPQYYVIVAAMTMTLFVGVSLNNWAPAHMTQLGVAPTMAAGALSAHALVNALARALGGGLATRIDPKWLLASALFAEIVGTLALSVADGPVSISLMIFGEGFGFGMCILATAVLLVNYYGTKDNPEIFGTMHMITTIAAAAPFMAGKIADTTGTFAPVFQGYSVVLLIILVLVIAMRPPQKNPAAQLEPVPAE